MKNKSLKIISALAVTLSLLLCLPFANAVTTSEIRAEITNEANNCNIKVYLKNPAGATDLSFYLSLSDNSCVFSDITAENSDLTAEINNFSALGSSLEDGKQYFSYATNKKENQAKLSGYFIKPYETDKTEILLFTASASLPENTTDTTLYINSTILKGNATQKNELTYKLSDSSLSENYSGTSTKPYGDVNNDGKVSASDARTILRYSVELEDISIDTLPYANMNGDEKISAQDARLALRTSVELEEKKYCDFASLLYDGTDCTVGGTFFFYCKATGTSFFMKNIKCDHIYSEKGCIQNKECVRCRLFAEHASGHSYNDKGNCINCGIATANLASIKADLLPVIRKMVTYNNSAVSNGNDKDFEGFFSDLTETSELLKKASAICGNNRAFRTLKENFDTAYKIRFIAINSVTDENGYIKEGTESITSILDIIKASGAFITDAENIINNLL